MDVYIVLDGGYIVGASARMQGAELIRTDEARRLAGTAADESGLTVLTVDAAYNRMRIVNVELQDVE